MVEAHAHSVSESKEDESQGDRTPDGRVFPMGWASLLPGKVAGLDMVCVAVRQLCTVMYEGKRYYVHHSVML